MNLATVLLLGAGQAAFLLTLIASKRNKTLPDGVLAAEFDSRVRSICALHHCSKTSGERTEKRNAEVGGHPSSWHRLERGALGADLVPDTNTEAKRGEVVRSCRPDPQREPSGPDDGSSAL